MGFFCWHLRAVIHHQTDLWPREWGDDIHQHTHDINDWFMRKSVKLDVIKRMKKSVEHLPGEHKARSSHRGLQGSRRPKYDIPKTSRY